jgi:hypothetical protein
MVLVIWVVAFLIAGFIPPPGPSTSSNAIAKLFEHHLTRIRVGLDVTMFASALLVPFAAAISAQMRRIEGPNQVLAGTQMAQGVVLSLEFIVPIMVLETAAYRPSAISPELIRTLDDMGWLMFVAVVSSVIAKIASIAFVIFLDRHEQPIFPAGPVTSTHGWRCCLSPPGSSFSSSTDPLHGTV